MPGSCNDNGRKISNLSTSIPELDAMTIHKLPGCSYSLLISFTV